MFNLFRKSGSRPPAIQVWEAMNSGDVSRVRRAFMKYPDELSNAEPLIGCHLHRACRSGSLAMVQSILDFGADIDLRDSRDGIAPIAHACGSGRTEVVKHLVSAGCHLDVSTSLRNPLFSCIASSLYRNEAFAIEAGFRDVDDVIEQLREVARLLIEHGVDLTACYIQPSMVDMDAAAFAYMLGRDEITEMVISALYGADNRAAAGAWAEAIEVALGNAFGRQKFRRWRRPTARSKNERTKHPIGEFWVHHPTL